MIQMPPTLQQESKAENGPRFQALKLYEKAKSEEIEQHETLNKNHIGNQKCETGVEEKRSDRQEIEVDDKENKNKMEEKKAVEEKSYDVQESEADDKEDSVETQETNLMEKKVNTYKKANQLTKKRATLMCK